MINKNGKMFSIIITVIYIRCILCTIAPESTVLTETSSAEVTDTTRVSTSYSASRTTSTSTQDVTSNTNTSQRHLNRTQTPLPPSMTPGTNEQANTSLNISNISSHAPSSSIRSTMPSKGTTMGVTDTTSHSTTIGQGRTAKAGRQPQKMTLEEKQKRNGITSLVICVGSLILIWIAYLSSFVDKPSEKVLKIDHDKLKNSKYIYDSEGQIVRDPNIKEEKGKKISFGEVSQFSQKQSPDTANGIQMTNIKETVTYDHSENIKQTKTAGKSGWDVFTQNRKLVDDYQPKRISSVHV